LSRFKLCPACRERPKPSDLALCHACRSKYGLNADNWPEWLRELVNSERRDRYADKCIREHEVNMPPDCESWVGTPTWTDGVAMPSNHYDDPDTMILVPDDQLLTRGPGEMAWAGRVLLPYAPYDNEEDNRSYRRANGIPER